MKRESDILVTRFFSRIVISDNYTSLIELSNDGKLRYVYKSNVAQLSDNNRKAFYDKLKEYDISVEDLNI